VAVKGIGVALSGGGHRASFFGLGALLYLGDAGKLPQVTSIASVSGGSLTNGYIAQSLDLSTADDGAAFEQAMGPFARQLAQRGSLFATPLTWVYVILLVATGLQAAPIGGSEAVVRFGLVRCRRGGRRLRLKPARPRSMSRPSHARRVLMVADQPLDPVGEGGVVADEPIGAVGGERKGHGVPADVDVRWLAASAASATRLTNPVADRKSS
jgi:hypothetical protein